MVTNSKLYFLYCDGNFQLWSQNMFFVKSFFENQNWTFIFVHFSNFKKLL
uniref:Uncharacterized protein n=1 Tax=viral metagenome TaxID=1070528 RepID=A0A6C0EG56_9ZZZZ